MWYRGMANVTGVRLKNSNRIALGLDVEQKVLPCAAAQMLRFVQRIRERRSGRVVLHGHSNCAGEGTRGMWKRTGCSLNSIIVGEKRGFGHLGISGRLNSRRGIKPDQGASRPRNVPKMS